MKTLQACLQLALGVPYLMVAGAALADKAALNFEAKAGLEHDRNLSVRELDRVAGKADTATLLHARLDGRLQPTDKLTLKAGYRYQEKAYREFDSFDQTLGTLSLDGSYDLSVFTVGGSYYRTQAKLAGDSFLELEQGSVHAGKLVNNRVYLRAALNRKEKVFARNANRNAQGTDLATDLLVFFNGADRFVSFGLTYGDENAAADEFDYDTVAFRSRLSNRFGWLGRDHTIELSWRYAKRNYAAVTPTLGARRDDVRRVTEASWEMPLNPALSVLGTVEFGNYDSTLPSADYRETLTSILLKASF